MSAPRSYRYRSVTDRCGPIGGTDRGDRSYERDERDELTNASLTLQVKPLVTERARKTKDLNDNRRTSPCNDSIVIHEAAKTPTT